MELYGEVRRAVFVEGLSRREAARRFGIDPRTVAKMLAFSVPPGYQRSGPPARPKLDRFIGIIDRILEEDRTRPAKQQHTAKRIFERLRDEHGYAGGITIVRDYVHERRLRSSGDEGCCARADPPRRLTVQRMPYPITACSSATRPCASASSSWISPTTATCGGRRSGVSTTSL